MLGLVATVVPRSTSRVLRLAALAVPCFAAPCPVFAAGCEDLRQSIETRIRANGVVHFTVTPVDAAASAPGQVVGTCEQGRIKLLYVRGAAVKQSPAASAVITECADGRVVAEGSCKK